MIKIITVDTLHERATCRLYKDDNLAFKYVAKIYHIPPQRRYVYVAHVYDDETSDRYIVEQISYMIGQMLPNRDTMELWYSYPLYYKIIK